jgi:hypothetical protein
MAAVGPSGRCADHVPLPPNNKSNRTAMPHVGVCLRRVEYTKVSPQVNSGKTEKSRLDG